MKTSVNAIAATIVLVVIPIAAQWPNYPVKSAPRESDGKVKLDAPAPKAPDGHPDLSGVWDLRGTLGRGGGPGGPGGGKGGGKGKAPELPPGTPPNATFKNIGAGFKE